MFARRANFGNVRGGVRRLASVSSCSHLALHRGANGCAVVWGSCPRDVQQVAKFFWPRRSSYFLLGGSTRPPDWNRLGAPQAARDDGGPTTGTSTCTCSLVSSGRRLRPGCSSTCKRRLWRRASHSGSTAPRAGTWSSAHCLLRSWPGSSSWRAPPRSTPPGTLKSRTPPMPRRRSGRWRGIRVLAICGGAVQRLALRRFGAPILDLLHGVRGLGFESGLDKSFTRRQPSTGSTPVDCARSRRNS